MGVGLLHINSYTRLRAVPFVKWAGGKGQLLERFERFFPIQFNNYVEPFVGGGAVFFYLYNQGWIANGAILNDLNLELMNCYEVIRDRVGELIEELRCHEAHRTEKSYFYEVRDWDRKPDFKELSPVKRAARTIFLNRTCYNGLYRVNSRGHFNVPFGSYKNPMICDEANLRAVSKALQGVELRSEGFERCVEWVGPGDFIYLDPPYHPLSETASFTSYTEKDFRESDQARLATVFRQLNEIGCYVMLSNSYTPLVQKLYEDHRKEVVTAIRAINCKGNRRGGIRELVVLNY